MSDEAVYVHYEGQQHVFDFDDFTLDEIAEVEDVFDHALEDLDLRRSAVIRQFVYVLLRRTHADITVEQIGGMKLNDLMNGGTP